MSDASAGTAEAVRGAIGFLTRLPVGRGEDDWEAFRRTPTAFVLAGYLVGALIAVVVLLPLPAPTTAALLPVAVVAVTGINHADGVADLGDAAVVHGDASTRHSVLKDSAVGVGGTLALAVLVAGLALAGLSLAGLPTRTAVGVVVASEVSAKLGMATLACYGTAPFDGLGAQLTDVSDAADLLVPVALALPATALTWGSAAGIVALVAGVAVAVATGRWATERLGGVNGDVFGAANELARVVALHAGVIAWTLW